MNVAFLVGEYFNIAVFNHQITEHSALICYVQECVCGERNFICLNTSGSNLGSE